MVSCCLQTVPTEPQLTHLAWIKLLNPHFIRQMLATSGKMWCQFSGRPNIAFTLECSFCGTAGTLSSRPRISTPACRPPRARLGDIGTRRTGRPGSWHTSYSYQNPGSKSKKTMFTTLFRLSHSNNFSKQAAPIFCNCLAIKTTKKFSVL